MTAVPSPSVTTVVHAGARLRLGDLARRYHIDLNVARAIRDEVLAHDRATRKARRAARSRAADAATVAAGLARQITALERRLDRRPV